MPEGGEYTIGFDILQMEHKIHAISDFPIFMKMELFEIFLDMNFWELLKNCPKCWGIVSGKYLTLLIIDCGACGTSYRHGGWRKALNQNLVTYFKQSVNGLCKYFHTIGCFREYLQSKCGECKICQICCSFSKVLNYKRFWQKFEITSKNELVYIVD